MAWVTIRPEELERGEEKLKGPHRSVTPKRLPWLRYCGRCGLVSLKNDASQRAWKLGCGWKEAR